MASESQLPPSRTPRRGLEAFASRDFRLYQLARVAGILGAEAQSVAVAWHVYAMTHRALDLGYTGLALFLPAIVFLLPAGHVADRFDRRKVILICYCLQLLCSATLLAITLAGVHSVWPIYAVLFTIGSGRAFSGPASSALIPHLVPEGQLVNAITWGGAIFQFANTAGPAVGGLLFTLPLAHLLPHHPGLTHEFTGAGIVYLFTLLAQIWFITLIANLHVRPGRMEHRAASLKVVFAGFQYVRSMPLLLGAFSLDLFVVLLGGAVALMPIFAQEILHTGPRGLGMLRAAPAVGAMITSLLLARFPLKRHAGRRLFIAVAVFGIVTIIFGLSRSLWLSLVALAISGAADMISVIVRGSLLQLATPPEMRGRVSAVNSLFLGASNEFGEFESGVTAQWWGAVRATVIGGIGSLCVAGLWAAFFPSLRQVDELSAEKLRAQAPTETEPQIAEP
ncbi:MFS transporter [Terracidiphilus gabretensis]|jgi:MFS family permease|uniref:MFS transporter n=1 Tax=Terracidiphilus gabretensis TaxID=1577687 RepID=UPI00071BA3EB|nr:MFS transporter [Terracidiphilus gabretensis]